MKAPMQVQTLDEVPEESIRSYYVQGDDGTVFLNIDGSGKTPAHNAVRGERTLRESAEARAREAIHEAAQARADRDKERQKLDALRGSFLDGKVTEAARVADVMPSAVADAMRAARESFSVGDDGQIVGRDASGQFADLAGWFAACRETSPHWYPATASGSGAPSNRVSGASSPGISRAQLDAMSPAQRLALAQEGVTVHD